MKNIKRKTILLLFFALIAQFVSAQETKKNSLYIELGGNAVLYSVNYDRIIPISTQLNWPQG